MAAEAHPDGLQQAAEAELPCFFCRFVFLTTDDGEEREERRDWGFL